MPGGAERSPLAVTDRNAAEGEEAGLVELAALVQKEQARALCNGLRAEAQQVCDSGPNPLPAEAITGACPRKEKHALEY